MGNDMPMQQTPQNNDIWEDNIMDEVGLASGDQVSSLGTPKKSNTAGPTFDANEFGPQAPVVQESALVNEVNRHKK